MKRDIQAFTAGLSVFFLLVLAYFLLAAASGNSVSPVLGWSITSLQYAAPLVSGAICARIARDRQFLALLALGVAASVVVGVLNFALSALGLPADLGGVANLPWVIGLSLFVQLPLVLVGGAISAFLARNAHA